MWRFESLLGSTRRLGAAAGVVALLGLAVAPEGGLADRFALMGLAVLLFAALLGWVQLGLGVRSTSPALNGTEGRSPREWLAVTVGVAVVAGLAMQSWFRPGTAVGLGDTVLPSGAAWIGRLFEPWTWSGFNMGEPSQLPLMLPWAAVLGIVNALGGDPGLAQRIWYTALFVGAALGALALIASLRMGPVAAVVGTAVYVLNPYVASQVNINPVFLAALCPLVAIPAALVFAGTGRLRVLWSAALCAAAAPLLGYVFFNPPLVGMILGVALGTPLLVAWIDGKEAAFRSFRALLLAVALLLPLSAYWIAPAALHLSGFTGNQLASVSSWSFTEVRSTIRNAFWLNTVWGWRFSEFYPFASTYDQWPVSLGRFVLPATAFAALGLKAFADGPGGAVRRDRELRLAIVCATIALVLILLSTGTNPPGNIVFDPLYNLPYGWLLREPGRFLMLAAVTYAVLVALTVEVVSGHVSLVGLIRLVRQPSIPTRLWIVPIAFVTALLVGFPIYTGSEIPDARPGLPAGHVKLPSYWTEMARYVDGLQMGGSLLVMPPDDFYGMPYSWGYYGADSFIPDLFKRQVLVPNPQGYSYVSTSPQVITAINLTAQSILRQDWRQTAALATALNTPLILVRRDIESPYAGRQIVSPNDLALALEAAPNFVLVHQSGLLELFALEDSIKVPDLEANFTTIDSQTPDLRLLSLLPNHAALISHVAMTGVPKVIQAPPLESWPSNGNDLAWTPDAPAGFAYRVAELGSRTVISLDHSGAFNFGSSEVRVEYMSGLQDGAIRVSITGRPAISNGDFTSGPWGPVSDCAAFDSAQALPTLSANIIANQAPGGLPALRLSASFDSACVKQSIDWRGKPLILSVMVDRIKGNPPRICLLEIGPNRCAPVPSSSFLAGSGETNPHASGWSTYKVSVTPDAGTTALDLYLYADAQASGGQTIADYANVMAVEVPTLPSLYLFSDIPLQQIQPHELAIAHETFSNEWQGSVGGEHVLVDGMLNGWLIPRGSSKFYAFYKPADTFRAAQWVSVVALLSAVLAGLGLWIRLQVRRRRAIVAPNNAANRPPDSNGKSPP